MCLELPSSRKEFIRSTDDLSALDISSVGVKAAKLGELGKSGLTTTGGATEPSTKRIIWSRGNLKEVMAEVATPLSASAVEMALNWGSIEQFRVLGYEPPRDFVGVRNFYGRLYFNLTDGVKIVYEAYGSPPEVALEAIGGPTVKDFELPRLGVLQRLRQFIRILRALRVTNRLPKKAEDTFKDVKERMRKHQELDLTSFDRNALEKHIVEVMEYNQRVFLLHLLITGSSFSYYRFVKQYCQRWLPPEKQVLIPDLMVGLKGIVVFEQNQRIWSLSEEAKREEKIREFLLNADVEQVSQYRNYLRGTKFLDLLDQFLADFGHRGPFEGELTSLRWREDPTPLLLVIKAYLGSADLNNPSEYLEEQEKRRLEATRILRDELSKGILDRILPYKRLLVSIALNGLHKFTVLRENSKHYMVWLFDHQRTLAIEIGRRLHQDGLIDGPRDIFFLTVDEVSDAYTQPHPDHYFKTLVATRKNDYEFYRKLILPDILVGEPSVKDLMKGEWVLEDVREMGGLGVSPGRASGAARIVTSPTEFHKLRKGEILVTPLTDSSWTPLFNLANGLVLEIGGMLSHGGIVAREFGIPAVANIQNATKILSDGDQLLVDGYAGKVTILET